MNAEDAAAVLAVAAEFDNRVVVVDETAGRVWAKALEAGRADDVEDAIEAVVRFYGDPDGSGEKITPGDVSRICREIRRERARASRQERQEQMRAEVAASSPARGEIRDRKQDLLNLIAGSGIIRRSTDELGNVTKTPDIDADAFAERHQRIEAIVSEHRNWPLVGDRGMRKRQAVQNPLLDVLNKIRVQQRREEREAMQRDAQAERDSRQQGASDV